MNNLDTYTKVVLTVIAACLSILTFQQSNIVPEATASSPKTDVVGGVRYGLVPLNEDGSVSVRIIAADEIDVNISGVDTYDELNVNIDEVGGNSVSSGGPINVRMK